MNVKVEDLKEGDEIIVSANSDLKYLRLLRNPQVRKGATHWHTGGPVYKSVKCSLRRDLITSSRGYSWKRIICTPEEHNDTIYQDLNGRAIWLVKRKND